MFEDKDGWYLKNLDISRNSNYIGKCIKKIQEAIEQDVIWTVKYRQKYCATFEDERNGKVLEIWYTDNVYHD